MHIIEKLVIIVIVGTLGLVILATIKASNKKTRLIKECMEDGHKEYECEALLKSNKSSIIPVPLVIPAR